MLKYYNRLHKLIQIIKKDGLKYGVSKVMNVILNKLNSKKLYINWINENEKDILTCINLQYKPLISIIVPVYNVDSKQLEECIKSVINQTYDNWELILIDDASTWQNVKPTLSQYENKPKIKVIYRDKNGHISKATNTGLKASVGEFIGLLDCDDTLSENAIYEVTKVLNKNKNYDFIYSDEDKISENGRVRHTPFFKPDWSPDTLMSFMYTCHFSVYRKSIVEDIGGFRIGVEGSQDYDLVLRFTEKTNNICHIPKILYHWRERKQSTSVDIKSKSYVFKAMEKVKIDTIKRRKLLANVIFIEECNQFRITYKNDNPKVSIIIPSKDNYNILENCIKSIVTITQYSNYEIILVDNGSNQENKDKYLQLCTRYNILYEYKIFDFNFSKMCNIGSNLSNGELLLFLNDDTEIIHKDWLSIMVGQASLNHIGAVGVKLLYPNSDIIQHSGVVILKDGPSHLLIGKSDKNNYCYWRNRLDYNFIAVTGACLMVNKDKFNQVNGFDESFPIAYNDVDLCFKLVEKGYFNVIRNDVTLYHYESISRGLDSKSIEKEKRLKQECIRLFQKHPLFKEYDPFYQTKVNIDINLRL